MITETLSRAWRIYRTHFGLIAALTVAVWLPCELVISYLRAFVHVPEDTFNWIWPGSFVIEFIGIIAVAGVTYLALSVGRGKAAGFREALGAGCEAWWRVFWTRLASGVVMLIGLLLLIVPGIYLMVRLCVADTIAVAERVSGPEAMGRSFDLTKGLFWPACGLVFLLLAILIAPELIIENPARILPALDRWPLDAGMRVLSQLLAAYYAVAMVSAYEILSERIKRVQGEAHLS
jgi:hypothetical protein